MSESFVRKSRGGSLRDNHGHTGLPVPQGKGESLSGFWLYDQGGDDEDNSDFGLHCSRVSDGDYELLLRYQWRLRVGGKNRYAVTTINGEEVGMHRVILGAEPGQIVDHINGDGLCNQRENLRFCTRAQNFQNGRWRNTKGRTSKHKGEWRIKNRPCRRCWRSGITAYRVYRNLGSFWTEEEAARAYDAAARRLHGEFARPNFPEPKPNASDVPGHRSVIRDRQPTADEGEARLTPPRPKPRRRPRPADCGKCRRQRRR